MSKPVPMSQSFTDEDLHNLRKPIPFHFGRFLYNADEGTVMGRDRSSWGKFMARKSAEMFLFIFVCFLLTHLL